MNQKELRDQLIDPNVREDLLTRFCDTFKSDTQIPCYAHDEGVAYGGWFNIIFKASLNADQLIKVAEFIKDNFSVPGTFSHILPKIGASKGEVCLIVQDSEVQRIAEGGKI
jgi:hypothetical protein